MIQVAQVHAELLIKCFHRFGRVVVAKPPEPVGTFTGGELFFCAFDFFFIQGVILDDAVEGFLASTSMSQARFLSLEPIQVENEPYTQLPAARLLSCRGSGFWSR